MLSTSLHLKRVPPSSPPPDAKNTDQTAARPHSWGPSYHDMYQRRSSMMPWIRVRLTCLPFVFPVGPRDERQSDQRERNHLSGIEVPPPSDQRLTAILMAPGDSMSLSHNRPRCFNSHPSAAQPRSPPRYLYADHLDLELAVCSPAIIIRDSRHFL